MSTSQKSYLFVFLYRMHVQPYLEYSVSIWSPSLAKDIDALEKVQKKATKMVRGLGNLPYEQTLKSVDLVRQISATIVHFVIKA